MKQPIKLTYRNKDVAAISFQHHRGDYVRSPVIRYFLIAWLIVAAIFSQAYFAIGGRWGDHVMQLATIASGITTFLYLHKTTPTT